jgi:hypothetical protein
VFSIFRSRIALPQLAATFVVLATGMTLLGTVAVGIYDYSYMTSMIDVQPK